MDASDARTRTSLLYSLVFGSENGF